jgi:hypothetical protein
VVSSLAYHNLLGKDVDVVEAEVVDLIVLVFVNLNTCITMHFAFII